MKKISFKLIYKTCLVCSLLTVFSCKKVFDLKSQDQVDAVNAYQNVYDANAAVIGIYGQFMNLADRYVVLNELRADLMSPTANADKYLKQLNEHSETTDNPWADPKPWYKVIQNCNDAMYHFDDMLKTGKLKPVDYQQRYSDVGSLRCWLYLQLGIQYGSVPYVTDPITNLTDLNDASKFPRLSFNQLLDKLVTFMNDPARYLDVYSTTDPITTLSSSILNTTVDGYATNLFFINKYAILGDVNLWKGNYNQASVAYRYLMDYGIRTQTNNVSQQALDQYKPCYDIENISYGPAASSDGPQQFNENNFNDGPTTGWREIFAAPTVTTNVSCELIWRLPFNNKFQPTDPFIDLFSNQGGKYLLTASQLMMDNYNSQLQSNGLPYDARGRIAVRTLNGQPVIMKQLYYYLDNTTFAPVNLLQKNGYWTLYRSGALGLRFAEAADNDNQVKLGYALLNVGPGAVFAPNPLPTDRTNTMQTFLPPPYDMDGRTGGPQNYHGPFQRYVGTRSRAHLVALPATLYTNNDKLGVENAIIDDAARELSFEGYRYGDLVRIALRRGDPHFLADKVYAKLVREGNSNAATVQAKLLSPGGFYMPFKM
jgi:hypothetical protein